MELVPLQATPFGREMRQRHFLFHPSYRPLNQGAYGTFPAHVRSTQQQFQTQQEWRPDAYLRYQHAAPLLAARKALASLVHADVADLVFTPNVTTGYNTILRSLQWSPGDVVVHFESAYGTLVKTLTYLDESTALRRHRLAVSLPCSDDELVAAFEREIRAINDGNNDNSDKAGTKERVRVAIFDTVSSMPGMRLPFERLVASCRALGVLSLVDGAHGVGMMPLDLGALDADFFVSNLHKWLHVPRACALLHVPPRNQHLVRSSLPTSWGFVPAAAGDRPAFAWIPSTLAPFEEIFQFAGTGDTSNYLTVPAALRWRREVCGGEAAVMDYCVDIARRGGDRVAEILGTEVMDCQGTRLRDCAMANIRLPVELGEGPGKVHPRDGSIVAEWIFHQSHVRYDTYFQPILWHGTFWCRLSGAVYLDMDDFEWAGQTLKEMCEVIAKGRDQYAENDICKLCAEAWRSAP